MQESDLHPHVVLCKGCGIDIHSRYDVLTDTRQQDPHDVQLCKITQVLAALIDAVDGVADHLRNETTRIVVKDTL